MEMSLNKGFCEMSQDELMGTEGGVLPLVEVAALTAALYGCYQLGVAVGKFADNTR